MQSASKTGAAAGWLRGKVGSPPVNGRSVPRASVVLTTLRTTTYHYHPPFLTQLHVFGPPNYLPISQLLYFIESRKKGLHCSYPEQTTPDPEKLFSLRINVENLRVANIGGQRKKSVEHQRNFPSSLSSLQLLDFTLGEALLPCIAPVVTMPHLHRVGATKTHRS